MSVDSSTSGHLVWTRRREKKERACKGKSQFDSGVERSTESSIGSLLPSQVKVSNKVKDKGKCVCASRLPEISDNSECGSEMDGLSEYNSGNGVSRERKRELEKRKR